MEQIAGLAKVLADRLGALFGVLDLSFFVAGGVTLLALTFVVLGVDSHAGGTLAPSLVGVTAILLSYACGLVSMAMGRWMRRQVLGPWRRPPADNTLGGALAQHLYDLDLHQHPRFAHAFHGVKHNDQGQFRLTPAENTRFVRLYAHLWAVLRQEKSLAPSLEQLNGLWVRTAVMDGLLAAFLVWAAAPWAVLCIGDPNGPVRKALVAVGLGGVGALSAFLVAGAFILAFEARRTDLTLVEELAGTMAWHLLPAPPATGGLS